MAHFFIDRPIFAWVIALAVMLAGAIAITRLPVAQYPSIAPPSLSINATYPGASAQTVEDTVTTLIEQEINGVEGLLYMASSSDAAGSAGITVTFEPGTDLDIASVEVQNRIKAIEPRLPEEVRRQGVRVDKAARNYLMFAAISSTDGTLDRVALGNYATTHLIDQIRRVPGVGQAQLFGTEYAIRVWLNPARLTEFGLGADDIVIAIREQNVQIASGELGGLPAVTGQLLNATVVTDSRLSTPAEFERILLRTNADGSTVHLSDVATVELAAASYTPEARLNGRPAAAIGIKLLATANALATAKRVRQRLDELSAFFPPGVQYDVPYDTSAFVRISMNEVVLTLFEAIGLVFLVMYLFLQNLRATLIPTVVVPIALLGSFAGMLALGFSINVLTMFGLVLAIGILVDDAIVVIENVERIMHEEHLSPRDATRKAMSQITSAIVGITLVLTAVFIPMAFFGGSVGAIYRQFSLSLVVSMVLSAFMALSLTPALCAHLLKPVTATTRRKRGLFSWFNAAFDRTTRGYAATVGYVIRRGGRVLLVYLAIVGAAGWILVHLPSSFLPNEDQGYFLTIVQLPPGATHERTLKVLDQVEDYFLNNEPNVDRLITVAGFSFFGSGQNAGIIFGNLKPWDQRRSPEQHVQAIVGRAFGFLSSIKDAIIFPLSPPPIPELGTANGFEFELQDRVGLGHDALTNARNQLLGLAAQDPFLSGVRPEGLEDTPQLDVAIDRSKARALGVPIAGINDTLSVMLGSSYANDFVREGRVQRVLVQAEAGARMLPEDILALRVRNADGEMVPFASFAEVSWRVASPRLARYNGLPAMRVAGQAAPGYSSGEAMAALERLAAKLPAGFGFEWTGQSFEERLSSAQAPTLFALSVLVVFLCLAALYESWSVPAAVMLVVPLGVFGALLAAMLRDMPNDVYFKVGLITIIGLSAKNAILIVEFARDLHARGSDVYEATLTACRLRFRPIIMTSLAFVLGVMPLALSTGAGAASRQAIGTGVMGGMITATVLGVVLVPVFFVTVQRLVALLERRKHADASLGRPPQADTHQPLS